MVKVTLSCCYLLVCSGLCQFICGRLGMVFTGCHSVLFKFVNMTVWTQQCDRWSGFSDCLRVILCALGWAVKLAVPGYFLLSGLIWLEFGSG